VLVAEIERQIAGDGGHAERSTHYHRYALDFYILALIAARLTRDPAAGDFEGAVSRLAAAARLLADDRGQLPHIGDDDGGALFPIAGRACDDIRDTLAIASALTGRPDPAVGPLPEEALWMLGPAVELPHCTIRIPPSAIRSDALPETGYYVSRSSASDHLVVDGGPHGCQNGGHAHADALSLAFTVRGRPLLVDAGTGCYTVDRTVRDRLRSSALHNTLTLDGRSQSVPSGPFHWANAADGRVHCWRTSDGFDYFDGSHDGYRPAMHRRRVLVMHGDLLVVADFVDAAGAHTAAVHWHVHPDWDVQVRDGQAVLSRHDAARAATSSSRHDDWPLDRVTLVVPEGTLERFRSDQASGLGWYSPAYGRLEPATTIRLTHAARGPFWIASVFDLSAHNRIAAVEWLPVRSEGCALACAAMLRISRAESVDDVLWTEPPEAGREPADQTRARLTGRVGDLETDARMLFSRVHRSGRLVMRLAMVDGSVARDSGRGIDVTLPERAPVWNWASGVQEWAVGTGT
jgi:Heparinase II/III-like protein